MFNFLRSKEKVISPLDDHACLGSEEEVQLENRLVEELLEGLWMLDELALPPIRENMKMDGTSDSIDGVLPEMTERGLIEIKGDRIEMTPEGREMARQIIRCHRLAERLLVDVLAMGSEGVQDAACRFEHILTAEVADSICTLLGHPKTCPHGKLIPPGDCCECGHREIEPILCPLSEIKPGERSRVAYIETSNPVRLDRLASLGVMPGSLIHLNQRHPSFVIRTENTNIAIDRDIASHIFVRKL